MAFYVVYSRLFQTLLMQFMWMWQIVYKELDKFVKNKEKIIQIYCFVIPGFKIINDIVSKQYAVQTVVFLISKTTIVDSINCVA